MEHQGGRIEERGEPGPDPEALEAEVSVQGSGIQTFLIADIRGYTRFTQERGDEAAVELARRFAGFAREGIEAHGGSIVELRGDEALAVFDSPRRALRAAVDLQALYLAATEAEPDFPLGVGIGVDAGEAVPVEAGYRGGALNLAARLCSLARPGEILSTLELVHFRPAYTWDRILAQRSLTC